MNNLGVLEVGYNLEWEAGSSLWLHINESNRTCMALPSLFLRGMSISVPFVVFWFYYYYFWSNSSRLLIRRDEMLTNFEYILIFSAPLDHALSLG